MSQSAEPGQATIALLHREVVSRRSEGGRQDGARLQRGKDLRVAAGDVAIDDVALRVETIPTQRVAQGEVRRRADARAADRLVPQLLEAGNLRRGDHLEDEVAGAASDEHHVGALRGGPRHGGAREHTNWDLAREQRGHCAVAAIQADQVDIEPLLLEIAALDREPECGLRRSNRRVRNLQRYQRPDRHRRG